MAWMTVPPHLSASHHQSQLQAIDLWKDVLDPQKTARIAGWLFIVTFVASIPAFFICYKPLLITPTTSWVPAPTAASPSERSSR